MRPLEDLAADVDRAAQGLAPADPDEEDSES
jgi:hypothetical protein